MFATAVRQTVHRSVGRWLSSSLARPAASMDPIQAASLKETCFLVDDDDKVIGTASKRECHAVDPDGKIPLHRAFSVFLFNMKGDLLLQKRSPQKVTYPNYYANSCCSHPLADFPGEDEEKDALGIKRAAQRRLNYELGIPREEIPLEKFNYITRIHYLDTGNGQWGEHEIDYILFLQQDFTLNPNSNEVSALSFVPKDELNAFLPTLDGPISPWFALILKNRLKLWWDNLHNLDKFKEHSKVLNLGKCAPC